MCTAFRIFDTMYVVYMKSLSEPPSRTDPSPVPWFIGFWFLFPVQCSLLVERTKSPASSVTFLVVTVLSLAVMERETGMVPEPVCF